MVQPTGGSPCLPARLGSHHFRVDMRPRRPPSSSRKLDPSMRRPTEPRVKIPSVVTPFLARRLSGVQCDAPSPEAAFHVDRFDEANTRPTNMDRSGPSSQTGLMRRSAVVRYLPAANLGLLLSPVSPVAPIVLERDGGIRRLCKKPVRCCMHSDWHRCSRYGTTLPRAAPKDTGDDRGQRMLLRPTGPRSSRSPTRRTFR